MESDDLVIELEKSYGWDLLPKEKESMIIIAKNIGCGSLIEQWQKFQNKFPGHSVGKFKQTINKQKEIPFWENKK